MKKTIQLAAVAGCLAATVGLSTGDVSAQAYPTKVVRIITTAPGSGTELAARIIARGLTRAWGNR